MLDPGRISYTDSVICPACQHDNRDGAKFCEECAAPLKRACAQCGLELRPSAKFCDECGAKTTPSPGPSNAAAEPARLPLSYTPKHLADKIRQSTSELEGERKTITVVFADLKGSTALIEGLDPEAARAVVDPALQLMMDAVHRYEGYVAQVMGDGILALFGAPIAQEDHAQRALFAALQMQDAMRHYSDRVRLEHGAPLALRVGVNTGEVVVRSIRKEDLHTDYVPVGHSINLAARMEQMATPGSILITAHTQKLVAGYFALKPLGEAAIKGVEQALAVFEVTGVGESRTRLEVAERRGLTRFVGREQELVQMLRALEEARAGHGQVISVMGEPGMGKSRLFHEFRRRSPAGCLSLAAYSVSHGKASVYLPVIELLKGYFRIESADDERTRREKITGKVLTLDRALEEILPYLFTLFDVEEQPSPLANMDLQIRRRRTFEALKKLFLRESLKQPLMLVFEDLHWVDSETQGLLDVLCESIASARLLLLTNYRPEYRHEWGHKTYYTQLRLAPLGRAEMEELLGFLLGEDASLAALKSLILEKTEGTPFFMEEVVQALAEQGTLSGSAGNYRLAQQTTALQLPPTVQGILAARIDRLAPEEKALLQQLAVVGRNFPLSLIREVLPQADDERYRLLATLQRKEFLYEQPAFPEVEYIFKHALTQEVAYNTVLQEQRKVLHERTACAIETLNQGNLEDHYPALAHHYSRSSDAAKAVEYLTLAGEQAARRSADAEAVACFTAALDLFKTLPDAADRARQELTLQLSLGALLMATSGYTDAGLEQAYTRARELCLQVGEPLQNAQVLFGLLVFSTMQGDLVGSLALGEQFLPLAQRQQEPALSLVVEFTMAATLLWMGQLDAAQAHYDRALTFSAPESDRELSYALGQDLGSCVLVYSAACLWLRGYPDRALAQVQRGLSTARDLGHPFSLAEALGTVAIVHLWRRDGRAAQAHTEALVSLAHEQGFPWWLALGPYLDGWALTEIAAQNGAQEALVVGLEQLEQGRVAVRSLHAELWSPLMMGALAESYARNGRFAAGLDTITEALMIVTKNEERWTEAELYRLKGEMILQSAAQHASPTVQRDAQAYFEQALDIARAQGARSWELRTATSLARLWQQQGKQDEAHSLLSQTYQWFTEGFDTRDLQDAKALLHELSSA